MAHSYFTKAAFLFVCALMGFNTVTAQEKESAAAPKPANRHYIFTPISYSSASSGSRQLAPADYIVEIMNDSINVFLPYYGASFTPQINQTDGGTRFTSKKFEYTFTEKKKGQCEISIKPKDASGVQQLFLRVFSDGIAMLQLTSTNREPTSFNGYFQVK